MPYIPFPGFCHPRRVSHLCSGTLPCYHRGKVLGHRIATSATSRLLRQRGGGYRDQFGLHQRLGQLWFTSALHDVDLHVRHILGEHNTLAYALSRWHNTSSQTRFAQAATALGISYFFEEIPGDFCYFDLV